MKNAMDRKDNVPVIKNVTIPHPRNKDPDYGTFLHFDDDGSFCIIIDQTKYHGPYMVMHIDQWLNLINLDREKEITRREALEEFGVTID